MNQHENKELKQAAKQYVARWGFSVVPISASGSKKPVIKWKELQSRRPSEDEIDAWPAANIAIVTGAISGIVIVDCESREDAEWFWRTKGRSSVIVQSRRGFHFYFRHPGWRVPNAQRAFDKYDIRGDGGYALAPPSLHKSGRYGFVIGHDLKDVADLPLFEPSWLPERTLSCSTNSRAVSNGLAYISRIRAVSGQRGGPNTFRAACRLRDAGMTPSQALAALIEWNQTNAEPPWSTSELLHKVEDAFK